MTDDQDRDEPQDEENAPDEERPRTRKHRRATRPATGGDPAVDVPPRAGRDDTDAGWAPDGSDIGRGHPTRRGAGRQESARDRWWREQRPPHYE